MREYSAIGGKEPPFPRHAP